MHHHVAARIVAAGRARERRHIELDELEPDHDLAAVEPLVVELGERDPEGLDLGAQRAVVARHNVRSAQRHAHSPYEFIGITRECTLVRIPYGEDHLGGEKRPPLCEQRLELLLRLLRTLLGRHGCRQLLLHRRLPFHRSAAQPQAHADACANARA